MQLTGLYIDGLKGLRNHELIVPPLLALEGPNGSNKTAHQQGIRLGVIGHDPEMGRTLAATRALAGGKGDIQIREVFDTGFSLSRAFGRSTHTEVFPPRGETTEKEKQARIDEETGAFPLSFDLGSFLSLSDQKRQEALFALLPRELLKTWSVDLFKEWLGYADASTSFKNAIDRLWIEQVESSQSPIEGLASALDFIHKKFLEADADRKRQENVARAAAEKAEAAASARAAVESDGAIDELQVELSSVDRRLGELREKKAAAEAAVRRHREADDRMSMIDGRIGKNEAHLEELRGKLAETSAPDSDETERLSTARAEAASRLNATRFAVSDTSAALRAAREQLEKITAEYEAVAEVAACPTCGELAGIKRARATLKDQAEAAAVEVKTLVTKSNAAVEAAAEASKEYERAEAEHESIVRSAADFERLTREVRQAESLLEGVRREREALEARGLAAPDVDLEELDRGIESLEEVAHTIRGRIRKLQDAAESVGRARGAIDQADEEKKRLDTLTARASGLKALRGGLQKLRGHVIEEMVSPVTELGNELLQSTDPAKKFVFLFEREGQDAFDLGFEEAGVFRSYDAASTGEDAFLAIVFVTAVINAVKPRWRVLQVDNIETIDAVRREALMEALAKIVPERLDNVILSGCASFPAVDGWEIHHLQPTETLAGAA